MENFLTLDEITLIPSDYNVGIVENKLNYLVEERIDSVIPKSLPVFTSPLAAIIDQSNYAYWQQMGVRPVIPRTEPLRDRLRLCTRVFTAFTLREAKQNFIESSPNSREQFHVCLDTGNGHNTDIFDLACELKKRYGDQIILMGGPLCSVKTYEYYSKSGFDFVRVGLDEIDGVPRHSQPFRFPMGSLLEGIKTFKSRAGIGLRPVKIIANSEIENYADILKAIALGADYVMIGQDFSRVIEAAGTVLERVRNSNTGEYGYNEVDPKLLRDCAGYKAKLNGYVRYYYSNRELEAQAVVEGFNSVDDWRKKPGQHIGSGWETVDIDCNLQEWIDGFKLSTRNAFRLSNSTDWGSYQKNIKYGSLNLT